MIRLLLFSTLFFGASMAFSQNKFRGCWVGFDHTINHYTDSLNYIKSRGQLPKFLADHLIDWWHHNSYRLCLANHDEIISTRVAILDRVYREDVLTWIVESKNKDYDKLYAPTELEEKYSKGGLTDYSFPDFPYMKYSWRELAKRRLDQVKNAKNKFR